LVWDEKLLEHWIAAQRLGLMDYQPADIYIDVSASNSPWARALRERLGISAFAIDLCQVGPTYLGLDYYRTENATATSFADGSFSGVSLHCAYEMFTKDDDINLLVEMKRILKPSGKLIIVPLYMHTHYCAYSTPEYYGKGHSDPTAKEYVRLDCFGIPSSRKYDAKMLKMRILDTIKRLGMEYQIFALRNKADLGRNIYCHFILEITR
jgi:SAM-dependent methyltransferase